MVYNYKAGFCYGGKTPSLTDNAPIADGEECLEDIGRHSRYAITILVTVFHSDRHQLQDGYTIVLSNECFPVGVSVVFGIRTPCRKELVIRSNMETRSARNAFLTLIGSVS